MGGANSGTWSRLWSKPTVESRLALDLVVLRRMRLLSPDSDGCIVWTCDGQPVARAHVFVGPDLGDRMYLTVRELDGSFNDRDSVLRLVPSYIPHSGGKRWWLLCPRCDARVRILFWDNHTHFLCRTCGGLTYYSRKTAHGTERGFAQLMRLATRRK